MKLIASLLCVVSLSLFAAEPRHNEGGTVGPNGVLQKFDLKIMKTKTNADSAFIQIDLGEHKYDSNKPDLLINMRPMITLRIGTTVVFSGQADKKGKINSPNFNAKVVNNGKGLQFTLKKENLSALLAELSGKGEHVPLTLIIEDNHLPAALTKKEREAIQRSGARHEVGIYENTFELDVDENAKVLKAEG